MLEGSKGTVASSLPSTSFPLRPCIYTHALFEFFVADIFTIVISSLACVVWCCRSVVPLLCGVVLWSNHTTPHHITPPHATPHYTTPHHTTPHHTTPHHTTPHHATPHHITSHHTTPHHTTAPHNTTHHTTPGTLEQVCSEFESHVSVDRQSATRHILPHLQKKHQSADGGGVDWWWWRGKD